MTRLDPSPLLQPIIAMLDRQAAESLEFPAACSCALRSCRDATCKGGCGCAGCRMGYQDWLSTE